MHAQRPVCRVLTCSCQAQGLHAHARPLPRFRVLWTVLHRQAAWAEWNLSPGDLPPGGSASAGPEQVGRGGRVQSSQGTEDLSVDARSGAVALHATWAGSTV